MRLWSLHPSYLDKAALVACWREGLLARKVLCGNTKGYRNHPQLIRFKEENDPVALMDVYLTGIYEEAKKRNYNFDSSKINLLYDNEKIPVTTGQVAYEWEHLKKKLMQRDQERYQKISSLKKINLHPLFRETEGEIEKWEVPVP
ncbi:MAG: pyrimidine dimer DNA glycosylase/endonuclease V [Candidatus Azobacteroides sp.]|nr:pyrimidine dimer DNA glycosylase/endonuclease V [Candidatus Azobacteroides sp.]